VKGVDHLGAGIGELESIDKWPSGQMSKNEQAEPHPSELGPCPLGASRGTIPHTPPSDWTSIGSMHLKVKSKERNGKQLEGFVWLVMVSFLIVFPMRKITRKENDQKKIIKITRVDRAGKITQEYEFLGVGSDCFLIKMILWRVRRRRKTTRSRQPFSRTTRSWHFRNVFSFLPGPSFPVLPSPSQSFLISNVF